MKLKHKIKLLDGSTKEINLTMPGPVTARKTISQFFSMDAKGNYAVSDPIGCQMALMDLLVDKEELGGSVDNMSHDSYNELFNKYLSPLISGNTLEKQEPTSE